MFCGPDVATFKGRESRIGMPDLRHTIENFARRVRSKFRANIERDAAQFKRCAVSLFRQNLPPQPGRPCSNPVTRAFRLRAREVPWPEVYRVCLPAGASQRVRFNLRVAVRMRRLRLREVRAKPRQANSSSDSSASASASRLTKGWRVRNIQSRQIE